MDFRQIRATFLDYFKARDHRIVESSSLVPRDDPTLLFTNAGMVQFKGAFLGEDKPGYTRAATSQKCMRAGGKHNDLDNVGYTPRHHTFFEMLGNFSFGDYFKEEAIHWAWDLLTRGYRLPSDRLYVSVFKDDDEAYRIWEEKIGIPTNRIVRLGEKDNFWAMGDTGPCGPCSEIHMDQGPAAGCERPECGPGCDCNRYLEIWNLVFTQFDRGPDGRLTPLPRPNIDTGMGLERITAVIQGVASNYDTDIFRDIIGHIQELSQKSYGDQEKQDVAFRVIADHARAVAFLIGDGVIPANEGRGYVLRRIIRRAIRFAHTLDLKGVFLRSVCTKVIEVMGPDYAELVRGRSLIEGVVENEERRFADTLQYSMRVLEEEMAELKAKDRDVIPGEVAFKLYDTYGLSLDIVEDVARDEHLNVDREGFEHSMARQRTLSQESWKGSGEAEVPEVFRGLMARGLASRFVGYDTTESESLIIALVKTGSEVAAVSEGEEAEVILNQTPFYAESGGQVGDSGWLRTGTAEFKVTHTLKAGADLFIHKGRLETGRMAVGDTIFAVVDHDRRRAAAGNHTATHLLHAALREVLGDHVKQAGSLVSPERLRFDFSHFTQVSQDRLDEIERIVNRHIRQNLPLRTQVMSKDQAMETGAMAIFEEKYGDTVRLVTIGDGVSMELCGGTHTDRTGNIGLFRIVSEGAVAANMRRIEALTGEEAFEYTLKKDHELRQAASLLKTGPDQLNDKIDRLLKALKEKERAIESLSAKILTRQSHDLLSEVEDVGGVQAIAREVEASSPKELREWADRAKDKLKSGIVLLGARSDEKAMLICLVSKDLTGRFHAGKMVGRLSGMVGGKGGGRPDMAQGGGDQPEKLGEALKAFKGLIENGALESSPPG